MANTEKFTANQIIKAIQGSGGIKTTIATRLGCHRHTVDRYLREYATVQQAYMNETEKIDDLAESVVIKSIQDGNTHDAKWWLERRRRDKFAVRQEVTQNINLDMQKLDDDQITRMAGGEPPNAVLADTSDS